MQRRTFLGAAAALTTLPTTTPRSEATENEEPPASATPSDLPKREEEFCADIYEEQIIPARTHLIATRGEGAEPAKEELEEAVQRLEEFLGDDDDV